MNNYETPDNTPYCTSYMSPAVPVNFDTVLGYLAKTNPESLDILEDPIFDTRRDSFWLKAQCTKRNLQCVSVSASLAEKELGIVNVMAFPLELLDERLN